VSQHATARIVECHVDQGQRAGRAHFAEIGPRDVGVGDQVPVAEAGWANWRRRPTYKKWRPVRGSRA
jgi:hypothetical protein